MSTLEIVGSGAAEGESTADQGVGGAVPLGADKRMHSMIAATGGSLIEWFDFYIYTFMTIYFSPSFFPNGDQTTQLVGAAGIFAAGFLARPIGGWFFGRMADRIGRKRSMIVSSYVMCIGSFMVAMVPTYATLGVFAPILLLFARLLQGFSVGGSYGSVATYITEVAAAGRRGFYASWQYVTIVGAQLLALLLVYGLQNILSAEDIRAWGWRIPFFVGALGAVTVAYLRRNIAESVREGSLDKGAGTLSVLSKHRKSVLLVLMFTTGGSLYFYTFTTYLQKLFVNSAGMDPKTVSVLVGVILAIMMVLQPVFGAISDRVGRKTFMIIFGVLATVCAVPLLKAMSSATSVGEAFALGMTATLIGCFYTSISGVLKAELFPTKVRTLGVSLPYAISNALFGGSAEYVALQLKSWGVASAFFWYVAALAGLALIGGIWMPDTRKTSSL